MYSALINNLTARLKLELPSALAHDPLRAVPVGAIKPKFKSEHPPRPGSVLILLYEADGEIKFPLIKRPDYAGTHGGQVSLPGGKTEPGEDSIQTALRETHEEIGISGQRCGGVGKTERVSCYPEQLHDHTYCWNNKKNPRLYT